MAPSKWGASDRPITKSSANITRALATIKQNKAAITIGKYYHREAPAFGPRGWQMSIPGTQPAHISDSFADDANAAKKIASRLAHSIRRSRSW